MFALIILIGIFILIILVFSLIILLRRRPKLKVPKPKEKINLKGQDKGFKKEGYYDAVFNRQLQQKGLKLEDSIDDPNTDMQAMLLRDTKTNKLIIVFRGTEATRSGDVKADIVDGATQDEGVGHDRVLRRRARGHGRAALVDAALSGPRIGRSSGWRPESLAGRRTPGDG